MDKEFIALLKEQKPLVVHCTRTKYDVYIGRGTEWGNPFIIGRDGNRNEVIEKYTRWILTQDHLMRKVHKLRFKTLGCWCKPHACHGDVLTRLAHNSIADLCEDLYDEIKAEVMQEHHKYGSD